MPETGAGKVDRPRGDRIGEAPQAMQTIARTGRAGPLNGPRISEAAKGSRMEDGISIAFGRARHGLSPRSCRIALVAVSRKSSVEPTRIAGASESFLESREWDAPVRGADPMMGKESASIAAPDEGRIGTLLARGVRPFLITVVNHQKLAQAAAPR